MEEPAQHRPAGTLKLLDPRVAAQRPHALVLYEVVDGDGRASGTSSCSTWIQQARAAGVDRTMWRAESLRGADRGGRRVAGARDALPYDVDGARRSRSTPIAQRRALGATSKFPRWAIAYKFPARQATTQLVALELNVGRTGAVTPVGPLEPVELSGTTV